MAKKGGNVLGSWAFLIGVILAVVLALIGTALTGAAAYVLVIAGIIVGLLNIADEETTPFLLAGAVLIIASALGQGVVDVIPLFRNILNALLLLFVPATIIVAIRHVFSLARR